MHSSGPWVRGSTNGTYRHGVTATRVLSLRRRLRLCYGGLRVLLKDMDYAALGRGTAQIAAGLGAKVKRRIMSPFLADKVMSRVTPLTDDDDQGRAWPRHLAKADLVVEAVFEDLGVKHKVIQAVEAAGMPEHAVFATNTSALPIADIAKGSARPERVVGMHYFSPVPKMPLLDAL